MIKTVAYSQTLANDTKLEAHRFGPNTVVVCVSFGRLFDYHCVSMHVFDGISLPGAVRQLKTMLFDVITPDCTYRDLDFHAAARRVVVCRRGNKASCHIQIVAKPYSQTDLSQAMAKETSLD